MTVMSNKLPRKILSKPYKKHPKTIQKIQKNLTICLFLNCSNLLRVHVPKGEGYGDRRGVGGECTHGGG